MKRTLILILIASLLASCSSPTPHKNKTLKTYTVQHMPLHKTLFFTGTLQPLHESTLTSPVDAIVETMHYHYGQPVKKGDIVFTLNSAALQQQYNDTLTEYLKAKDNFAMASARFTGTNDLWEAGLISKNNYLSEKSSLNTTGITLVQATRKLSELLEKMGNVNDDMLAQLTLSEFDKVRLALTSKHNLVHLPSSFNGVLLYPPKATDDTSGRLSAGSTVKAGQVLALIGDLTGVSVEINVSEVDITEIKTGMPAIVRGIALGKTPLNGQLVAINAQASNSNGALPSFTAIVEVKKLNPIQQSLLKVGMSAAVELTIDSQDKLFIPIAAISHQDDKSIVHVLMPNGKKQVRHVITGPVHGDQVVIESGLAAGEIIIL